VPSRIGEYLQRGAGLPEAAAWTTWITPNLPLDLQNIKLKYGSESMTQLLAVSMPLDIWSYLPEHLGYRFVGHELKGISVQLPSPMVPLPFGLGNDPKRIPSKSTVV